MGEPDEETLLHELKRENHRLKEKVVQLEERLAKQQDFTHRDMAQATQVRRLLASKDQSIQEYADHLEKKVEELRRANEQLRLWMAALRLYQDLFENDDCAMIGLNHEGKVVLFNKTAVELLGEGVRHAHARPVEDVDFSKWDPGIPALARRALTSGRNEESVHGSVSTSAMVLGEAGEGRSVLLRISGKPTN